MHAMQASAGTNSARPHAGTLRAARDERRTSKGAQSAALTPTTSAELAHRELRRLKLMPFTHSSAPSTLVGTT